MKINYLIIHHTGVSRDKNPDQFEATNNYHKAKWNFKSSLGYYAGYHYEIAADGTIRQARSDNEAGAHTIGHNFDSIGISLDGNFDIEMPTPDQEKSLKELLLKLKAKYPAAKIAFHRQFANKTCPGKLIPDDWANNLIQNSMEIKLELLNPVEGANLKLWPEGDIVQIFGVNQYFYNLYDKMAGHPGIDIKGKKRAKVMAAHSGSILQVGDGSRGKYIYLIGEKMGDIYPVTYYGHLDEIIVAVGQPVKVGELIGYLGNTGMVTDPGSIFEKQLQTIWGKAPLDGGYHTHFGLYFYLDPIPGQQQIGYPNGKSYSIKDYDNGFLGAVDPMKFLINNQLIQNDMIVNEKKLVQIYNEILFRNPDPLSVAYIGQEEEKVRAEIGVSEERQKLIQLINAAKQVK